MFINTFPKNLIGLLRQVAPRHRFQAVMLELITPETYASRLLNTPQERHILTSNELAKADAYKFEKRQVEWLTGRICAKSALLLYQSSMISTQHTISPQQVWIENAEGGRPFIAGSLPPEMDGIDLSISHGAGHGIALVADTWCGIDIQQPRDTLHKVREKFCTAEEQDILLNTLPDLIELQHLTLMWGAKEAAKKALSHLRMPGFLELILTGTEARTGGFLLTFLVSKKEYQRYPATVTIATELYQDFGIAICLLTEENHA